MGKSKFDPNAAFKNIVGIAESAWQRETEIPEPSEQGEQKVGVVEITGNKNKIETRSKRVNIVVKPSVHSMAKEKCEKMNISLNECINQFLDKWSKDA